MTSEYFEMMAKTFQGLEAVLADELKDLGAEDVEIGKRVVSFRGDKRLLYRANFCCYTALRILRPILKLEANDADDLYDALKDFQWDKYLNLSSSISIDSTVNSEDFTHSKFVTYRVKDAIMDYFTARYDGKRPSVRIHGADVAFDVHISGNQVTISLDSSGESLHKRGYRVAQTEAPINEVLAAGLLKLAGWKGDSDLVDPMCGSGTFLIEAALIATGTPPGLFRQKFAFENWQDFDEELFEEIYNDDSSEKEFLHTIYGSDISPRAINVAKENVESAHMMRNIALALRPLSQLPEVEPGTLFISNPPYGERLDLDDIQTFYREIGSILKNRCKGCNAWLIGPRIEAFDFIGLKPSLRYPILNGSIECDLREYVIFDGAYSDFRKEGKSVKNDDFRRTEGVSKRFSGGGDRKFRSSDNYMKRDSKPKKFRDKDDRDRRREDKNHERRNNRSEETFERNKEGRIHDERRTKEFVKHRMPRLGAEFQNPDARIKMRKRKNRGNNEE